MARWCLKKQVIEIQYKLPLNFCITQIVLYISVFRMQIRTDLASWIRIRIDLARSVSGSYPDPDPIKIRIPSGSGSHPDPDPIRIQEWRPKINKITVSVFKDLSRVFIMDCML